jgi:hypothetical protein
MSFTVAMKEVVWMRVLLDINELEICIASWDVCKYGSQGKGLFAHGSDSVN